MRGGVARAWRRCGQRGRLTTSTFGCARDLTLWLDPPRPGEQSRPTPLVHQGIPRGPDLGEAGRLCKDAARGVTSAVSLLAQAAGLYNGPGTSSCAFEAPPRSRPCRRCSSRRRREGPIRRRFSRLGTRINCQPACQCRRCAGGPTRCSNSEPRRPRHVGGGVGRNPHCMENRHWSRRVPARGGKYRTALRGGNGDAAKRASCRRRTWHTFTSIRGRSERGCRRRRRRRQGRRGRATSDTTCTARACRAAR